MAQIVMTTCDQCGKAADAATVYEQLWWKLTVLGGGHRTIMFVHPDGHEEWFPQDGFDLCSPACLTAWAQVHDPTNAPKQESDAE